MRREQNAAVVKQLDDPAIETRFPGIPHAITIKVVPFLAPNFTSVLSLLLIPKVQFCGQLPLYERYCMSPEHSAVFEHPNIVQVDSRIGDTVVSAELQTYVHRLPIESGQIKDGLTCIDRSIAVITRSSDLRHQTKIGVQGVISHAGQRSD